MIKDEEDFMKAIKDHVKAELNARITAINTEKDDFTLDQITADDDHYVIAGELLDLPNDIFCQIAFDGDQIPVTNNKNDMISIPSFLIEVVFDNPKEQNTYFKSLRYMRALYEVMLEFEYSATEADDVQITKAVPMFITTLKRNLVASGVGVSAAIG